MTIYINKNKKINFILNQTNEIHSPLLSFFFQLKINLRRASHIFSCVQTRIQLFPCNK